MIDYIYNPDFWVWKWDIKQLAWQSWLLPLLAAVITRHFHRKDHRRIIAFVVYSLMMEHVTRDADLKYAFHHTANTPWYHLLIPGLFLLMTRFFADYLDNGKYRKLRWVLPLIFTGVVLVNAIWGEGFYSFPSTIVGLYSLTGIVLAIGYFVYLLCTLTSFYLEREPMFWVSSGLLIYFAGNFLLWLGMNFLFYNLEVFSSVYRISGVVTILLNLFFTVAILVSPTEGKDQLKVEEYP